MFLIGVEYIPLCQNPTYPPGLPHSSCHMLLLSYLPHLTFLYFSDSFSHLLCLHLMVILRFLVANIEMTAIRKTFVGSAYLFQVVLIFQTFSCFFKPLVCRGCRTGIQPFLLIPL